MVCPLHNLVLHYNSQTEKPLEYMSETGLTIIVMQLLSQTIYHKLWVIAHKGSIEEWMEWTSKNIYLWNHISSTYLSVNWDWEPTKARVWFLTLTFTGGSGGEGSAERETVEVES